MSVDWSEVRERLRRAEEAFRAAIDPSPERRRAILEERARRLAVKPAAPDPAPRVSVLLFRRGGERWAIPLADSRAVISSRDTQTFASGGKVAGLAAFRGRAVPVVEPGRASGAFQVLVVAEAKGVTAAVAADGVEGVGEVLAGESGPLPDGTQIVAAAALVGGLSNGGS